MTHHLPSRFPVLGFPFRRPPRCRFLGLAATCRTYRGILHYLVVVPAATPSLSSLVPSPPFATIPRHFSRTVRRSSRDLLPTVLHPRSSLSSRDEMFSSSSAPRLTFRLPLSTPSRTQSKCLSLPPKCRNSKPANFDLYPSDRVSALRLIRRCETDRDSSGPRASISFNTFSFSGYSGRPDTSCSIARARFARVP